MMDKPTIPEIKEALLHLKSKATKPSNIIVAMDILVAHLELAESRNTELEGKLKAITEKHIELGDKLPNVHAHDRWLIMENVIKSELKESEDDE